MRKAFVFLAALAIAASMAAAPKPKLSALPAQSPSGSSIDLAWTLSASAGVASQEISRATVSGGPYSILVTVSATTTTYSDTSAASGQNYCYVVRAVDANGFKSPYSNEACAEIPVVTASSLTLSASSVIGGNPISATVTLSQAAPSGGAAVTLSSSNTSAATVPASVTVAAGATTATFTVSTSAVASQVTVTISASYGGASQTADLIVAPVLRAPTGLTATPH
jgi:fibronectin type 3 domain-containing protein